jgi:hypothetical protein
VIEDSFLLGYDAQSLGNRVLMFRNKVVSSSGRVQMSERASSVHPEPVKMKALHTFDTSGTDYSVRLSASTG